MPIFDPLLVYLPFKGKEHDKFEYLKDHMPNFGSLLIYLPFKGKKYDMFEYL